VTRNLPPRTAPGELVLPPRPALVELASAILIVAGVVGIVTVLIGTLSGATDPFAWLSLALNAGSLALGLATRMGRLWIVALNYAAILGFLDLLGAASNPQALMIGVSEVAVVGILLARKPWFDALAAARRDQPLTPPTASPPMR
jgi:hypothetical protein